MVVEAGASGTDSSGSNVVLIPYQAATTLNGQLGAGVNSGTPVSTPASTPVSSGDVLAVNIGSANLSAFPAISLQDLDMNDVSWEADVITFWSPYMNLGVTTACPVPSGSSTATATATATNAATATNVTGTSTAGASSTPIPPANPTLETGSDRVIVNKVALASAVLGADLQAGNRSTVGTMRDAVMIRNTGGILYYIAQVVTSNPQAVGTPLPTATLQPSGSDNRLIALPPGAVNVRHENDLTVFYLLVPVNIFTGSPPYTGDFNNFNTVDSQWFDYWSQYIPMTPSALPR
jgi:hypothetical protein